MPEPWQWRFTRVRPNGRWFRRQRTTCSRSFEGQVFPLRLADAGLIDIAPYDTGFKTGVKITLSDWRQNERRLGLRLFLTVCLEGPDEDLVCDASAQENGAKTFVSLIGRRRSTRTASATRF